MAPRSGRNVPPNGRLALLPYVRPSSRLADKDRPRNSCCPPKVVPTGVAPSVALNRDATGTPAPPTPSAAPPSASGIITARFVGILWLPDLGRNRSHQVHGRYPLRDGALSRVYSGLYWLLGATPPT